MKINFIKSILMIFALSATIISCTEDDQTGDSVSVPTSPAVSIALNFSNTTMVENDSKHTYTVSLSETQIVDVKLGVSQIGGTAGPDDYEMTSSITIPAGYLSASGSITILSDDLIEETETLQIQIGSITTANASLTPITTDFTILNYTSGDLAIDLSWGMSIATDDTGTEISATDFADMVLSISTTPDLSGEFDGADGSGFETYVLDGSEPDGDYYVLAYFYDANSDIVRDLDFNLEFNQDGVINGESYDFPAAMSNASICDNNFFVLTKIVKTGNNYSFEDQSINNFENQQTTWSGTDAGYDSQVTTGVDCDGMVITGLNAGWMLDFWGEVVVEAGTVYYTVDASGVVTIPNQFLYTTTYNGAVQPDYNIEGTGTYNTATGTLNIQYSLIQDGWYLGEDYGEADGFFHAMLTK